MCTCIADINAAFKENGSNTLLDPAIMLTSPPSTRVKIVTMKANKHSRKKPENVIATFCPFCGASYVDKTADLIKPVVKEAEDALRDRSDLPGSAGDGSKIAH